MLRFELENGYAAAQQGTRKPDNLIALFCMILCSNFLTNVKKEFTIITNEDKT
jgi:hypothetical protein